MTVSPFMPFNTNALEFEAYFQVCFQPFDFNEERVSTSTRTLENVVQKEEKNG